MTLQKQMAKRMKDEMAARQLSVEGLSQLLGVAKSSTQDYLQEKGNPRADTIELIYRSLGVSLDSLLAGEDLSSCAEELPSLETLMDRWNDLHPKLYPLAQVNYRMALTLMDLSDELYKAEGPGT